MKARITSAFRIAEGDGSRKYTPGDAAEGPSAEWAVANGYGQPSDEADDEPVVKAELSPTNKAKPSPKNKSQ